MRIAYMADERSINKIKVLRDKGDDAIVKYGTRSAIVSKDNLCETYDEAIQKHLHCVREREKIINQGIDAWERERESLHQTSDIVINRKESELKVPWKKVATKEARPTRRKLSAEESLHRMKEFDKRKEAFVAALRKSKD